MPLADYSHWNEEAAMVWWEEEGKHTDTEPDPDRFDDDYESNYDEWELDDESENEEA